MKWLTYPNIHILDNASTYPSLLKWYKETEIIVEMLPENMGQLAIYNSDYINKFEGWVAYTDSDIELNPDTPDDFIERMIKVAEKYNYNKVGLALGIDDLPGTEYATFIKRTENEYWKDKLEEDVYVAHVDTTFSIIRVGLPFDYKALRIAGNMTAKHLPWYLDYDNLDEEEQYIVDHSSNEFSTTKRFVDSHKNQVTT